MEAAAWENEELFIRMVNEDSAAVEKTLFRAAKLPAPNTIRVSKFLYAHVSSMKLSLNIYFPQPVFTQSKAGSEIDAALK